MLLSIVIATYNRSADLKKVLGQLSQQLENVSDSEVVVIDNCSTDGTKAIVDSFAGRLKNKLRYIREDHQGKPFAVNRAIREAASDWLIFTDDDVQLTDDWVEKARSIVKDKGLRCFFGKIIPDWPCAKPDWYDSRMGSVIVQADHGDTVKHRMNYLVGANMGIHRSIFDQYGGFNESIKRFEDSEFSSRINKTEDIVYFPDLVVYHPVTPSRVTKEYFLKWYFEMGRLMDLRLLKEQGHKILGIPRWVYKEFFKQLFLSLKSPNPKDRFYHQLQMRRFLGSMKQQWFPSKD